MLPIISGFLSVFVNNILKMSMQKIGLIVGKFYPLHQGHINMILCAKLAVDQLHVFVCSDTLRDHQLYLESAFTKKPSSTDRVYFAQSILEGIDGITVHGFNEDGIPAYPNGWQAWSDRLKSKLIDSNIQPNVIFSSEEQDKDFYEAYFQTEVILVDPPRDKFPVSATKIRHSPFQYWTFIPTIIRPFFTRTIILEDRLPFISMILKLFKAVEVPNYEKIEFKIISTQEIAALLNQHHQEQRRISAIIGQENFIETLQQRATFDEHLLSQCQVLPISTINIAESTPLKLAEKQATFNEISSFINRLMLADKVPKGRASPARPQQ